jgi:hypothetical protein
LKLEEFGFKTGFIENGRPAYHPTDLLKLYIYGYLNRVRSSRQLEKECKRNIEAMCLRTGVLRHTGVVIKKPPARPQHHFQLPQGQPEGN